MPMPTLIIPVLKSLLLVASGMLLLRLSGRKSISQMTVGQTVVMISIGSIIIEPIITERISNTLIASVTFILFLISVELIEVKIPIVEKFLTGESKVVVQDGELHVENLRKMRLTVDKLENLLRQQGITKLSDVKTATLEPNGQIGYELQKSAQPLTIGEFEKALGHLFQQGYQPKAEDFNLFDEVRARGHNKPKPHDLQ
jgi:uncharacterized membrane protein YcaP (DUF421 family)